MAFPHWLTTIFSHSVGEFAEGLWTKATAEDKAGAFGKGWGDEHQLQELMQKIDSKQRPIWMDFVHWNFVDRSGRLTKWQAHNRLKKLRLFLTSWDRISKLGSAKTTFDKKDGETVKKVEEVVDILSLPTNKAVDFVEWCVLIIRKAEATELKKQRAKIKDFATKNKLTVKVKEDGLRRFCREAGYRELMQYFKTADLPIMPAPDESHFARIAEEKLEDILGKDVKPVKIAQASMIWLGKGSLNRRTKRQNRMKWAMARFYRWPFIPFIFIINAFTWG